MNTAFAVLLNRIDIEVFSKISQVQRNRVWKETFIESTGYRRVKEMAIVLSRCAKSRKQRNPFAIINLFDN